MKNVLNDIANDTIGGLPASVSNVTITIVAGGGLTGLTVNSAGALLVPANAAGSYVATYRVCDQITPTNCATARQSTQESARVAYSRSLRAAA